MSRRRTTAGMVARLMAGTDPEALQFQRNVRETMAINGSTEQEVLDALVAGMDQARKAGVRITARRKRRRGGR